jgi:D-glycerate 3-kinase
VEPPSAITRFCLDRVRATRAPRAHVVGVSGPQGGGKTTLTASLVAAMQHAGLRAVAVSIDDFYLTNADQRALAARHPGDRSLEHRGYPGTHDVALGDRVLRDLASRRSGAVAVPIYDKSAHHGRGDRGPAARLVEAPLDVVFVEGWMLGFRALPPAACPPPLRASNEYLPAYACWHAHLDAFVHLVAGDPAWIVDYRVDAERARRAEGQSALTDDEARDYIERFLPAYEAYVPPMVAAPPCARWLRALLGPDRAIGSITGSGDSP